MTTESIENICVLLMFMTGIMLVGWIVYQVEKTKRQEDLGTDLVDGMNEILYHTKKSKELEELTIEELENRCKLCGSQGCDGMLPYAAGCELFHILNKKKKS